MQQDYTDESPKTIAVVGAGAFGTAMAVVAARNKHTVRLLARDEKVIQEINSNRRNPKFLADIELPVNIEATSDIHHALTGVDLIILALPVQIVPEWLADHKDFIDSNVLLCNTAKGLHLKTKKLLSDATRTALGREQPYAILSGHCIRRSEIVFMEIIFRTFFCEGNRRGNANSGGNCIEIFISRCCNPALVVQHVVPLLHFAGCHRLGLDPCQGRAHTRSIGVELGGALKNPLAIGAGMIEGMGLGVNTMAAYVTRSSLELQVFRYMFLFFLKQLFLFFLSGTLSRHGRTTPND